MGRLFWKFFAFFFFAQLTAVMGVGVSIWWQIKQHEAASQGIEISRPSKAVVEAAENSLKYGGVKGLESLLLKWQPQQVPQVYAVDNNGKELLNREYTTQALESAGKIADRSDRRAFAKRVMLDDGQQFLLFVPEKTWIRTDDRGFGKHHYPAPDIRNLSRFERQAMRKEMRRKEGKKHMHLKRVFPVQPLLAGALASLLFAAILAWYFSKPIKGLRNAFKKASDGKLDVRIGNAMGGRRDELSDLGRDFDAMATRLGSLLQGQTRLLNHVSHELRSPLARMQMALGLARQDPDKINSSLDRIELETQRMDRMVGELLEMSRIESGAMHLAKETVELNHLLDSIISDAQFEADAKDIKLKLKAAGNYKLKVQPDLIYRAIENIVRNATKYSPAGSEVSIVCTKLKPQKMLQLVVSDQGSGVNPSELEDIFKPFVRGQSGSQMKGHGVGLAIAKQVIDAHGGQVSAKNLSPTGFSVEVLLPI